MTQGAPRVFLGGNPKMPKPLRKMPKPPAVLQSFKRQGPSAHGRHRSFATLWA